MSPAPYGRRPASSSRNPPVIRLCLICTSLRYPQDKLLFPLQRSQWLDPVFEWSVRISLRCCIYTTPPISFQLINISLYSSVHLRRYCSLYHFREVSVTISSSDIIFSFTTPMVSLPIIDCSTKALFPKKPIIPLSRRSHLDF